MRSACPQAGHRLRRLGRTLAVLLTCLGLAGVSLAAAGGKRPTDQGAAVVAAARGHLADVYVWGATGPDTWDCSGLTSVMWRKAGGVKAIPRTSQQQQAWTIPIPAEQALPGDLVFFGHPVDHVGIVASRRTTKAGTSVQMVDASASRNGVVERAVWTTGVVRYGRVPRKGMVKVRPWTPPKLPPPTPKAAPTPKPAPVPRLAPVTPLSKGLTPLAGLPARDLKASPRPQKAATLAAGYLGNKNLSDVALVRNVWRRAGGSVLPDSRERLTAGAARVAVKDARPGDLVIYGPPGSHVGIYVGKGLMISASRSLGKVVLRKVWSSPSAHFVRLTR